MNPRQRQGLMLILIAAVGLLGVFVLIANYVSSVSKQVGDKISVVELIAPLSPYQPVSANMLGEASVPQKWAGANAITDPGPLVGLISPIPLSPGTRLQQGMLNPAPGLTAGRRAISILITASTGVDFQIQPGDLVDVVASYSGSTSLGGPSTRDRAEVVIASAPVLSIAQPSGGSAAGSVNSALGDNSGVPVTLSLTPEQAVQLTYAESFATKLTLAKVAANSPPVTPAPYSPRH
jgi:pilus assembly protein CpaB